MAIAHDFDTAWARYQSARPVAAGITEGNRCAMVLAMALGQRYHPDPRKGETSFADLRDDFMVNAKGTVRHLLGGRLKVANRIDDAMEGQAFLRRYYVKAEQFARRLKPEWGEPDYVLKGSPKRLAEKTAGRRGVIYMEDAWSTGEDHVDLWNGETTAGYDQRAGYIRQHIEQASCVWLWTMTSMVRDFDTAASRARTA